MVLKLYGVAMATCTKRAAVILLEKKVPFEFHAVDFASGEHKSPAYLEKQPFGQVPYIDDDGFILYESRAIGYYIATKYANQGTPLVPTDLKANALLHQALSVEFSNFETYAVKAATESVFKALRGLEANPTILAEQLTALDAKLDVYDKILSKQKYLAGNELTVADLFHLPHGALLPASNYTGLESRPNVARKVVFITLCKGRTDTLLPN